LGQTEKAEIIQEVTDHFKEQFYSTKNTWPLPIVELQSIYINKRVKENGILS
jgi:hypothetical protein